MASTPGRIAFRSDIARALRGAFGFPLARPEQGATTAESHSPAPDTDFRLLIEHCHDAVVQVGPDGIVGYASPSVLQICGLPPEAFIGRPIGQFINPEDRAAAMAQRTRLLRGELEESTIIFRAHPGTGRETWIESRARLLRDPATGGVKGYVAFSHDVTEHIRLEAERAANAEQLKIANASLESLVRHFGRARAQAEVASEAKSRFLASMSHELRTPLNGILGYAQLLQMEGGLNPTQTERVKAMLGAGQHLLGMINRVLAISEIEAEHFELHTADFDPQEAAAACLDQVRPAAAARGLTVRLTQAADMPCRLTADPTRLRQVLLNLLGNAVKFTERGVVELRLGAAKGGGLRIEVADSGPGVAPEKQPNLFREFERLGPTNTAIEGAGLGLAISARLVRAMGGVIGYSDHAGGGSLFWLELPAQAGAVAPTVVAPQPAALQPAEPLRILVVDDVAMNRDVARSFLLAAGHQVVCAEGGAEAVALVAAGGFDVVLMDVRMPGMDGLEATRRIRALSGLPGRVPIVALTAQAFAEQVAICRSAGMNGHLAKPFTQEALLAAVETARPNGLECASTMPAATATAAGCVALPGADLPIFNQAGFEHTAVFLPPDAVSTYMLTLTTRGCALVDRLRAPDALARDPAGLADAAHAMAGSAGMFGFDRVAAVARAFERAVETGALDAAMLAGHLVTVLEASIEVLRQHPSVAMQCSPGQPAGHASADARPGAAQARPMLVG